MKHSENLKNKTCRFPFFSENKENVTNFDTRIEDINLLVFIMDDENLILKVENYLIYDTIDNLCLKKLLYVRFLQ